MFRVTGMGPLSAVEAMLKERLSPQALHRLRVVKRELREGPGRLLQRCRALVRSGLSLLRPRDRESIRGLLNIVRALRQPDTWLLARQLLAPRGPAYGGHVDRHVVMLVVSDIRIDPRVQKAAKVAVERGFRVTLVSPRYAWMDDAGWTAPFWGPGITFEFPDLRSQPYINHDFPWLVNGRLFEFCKRYRNVIFHGNDLNTALMGLHLARATDSVSICDFHEWFSENVTWSYVDAAYRPHGRFKRAVMRRAERLCLRHADHGITVCQSIADELQAMAPGSRPFSIIRNIPDMSDVVIRNIPDMSDVVADERPPLKEMLGLPASAFVVLWQGGIGPSRLLEPVIEALRHAPGVFFVIRGPGLEPGATYERYYADYATRAGVADRIRLLPPVPSREVVAAARGADAGLWTLPNLSKNFYLALPNKLFEYLAAELPVLVAEFPEAAALVRTYDVGGTFDPYSPESIARAMLALRNDPQRLLAMRANTQRALADMDAVAEWARLGDLYLRFANRRTDPA